KDQAIVQAIPGEVDDEVEEFDSEYQDSDLENLDSDADTVPGNENPFHPVDHFFEHFTRGFFCTQADRDRQFRKHVDEDTHTYCEDIPYLAKQLDPEYKDNRHTIPNVLGSQYFHLSGAVFTGPKDIGRTPDRTQQASCLPLEQVQRMHEGVPDPTSGLHIPSPICMHRHEYKASDSTPLESIDIDSVIGMADHPGVFQEGIMLCPFSTTAQLMSGRAHGIFAPVPDPEAPGGVSYVRPQEMPQQFVGRPMNWRDLTIHFGFPQIWLQRKHLSTRTIILTTEQKEALYAAIYETVQQTCTPATTNDLPSTARIAMLNAMATSKERSRADDDFISGYTQIFRPIPADRVEAVFTALERRFSTMPDFRGAITFFTGKGLKGQIPSTSYTELSRKWNLLWNRQINHRYLDPDKYWVDLGRQFTPAAGHSLLWTPHDISQYYLHRARKYKHVGILPITKHHLCGLRDV
ncbi:hypothetical protein F4804DRAFT_215834, partial [Jackrogersella minutella]